MKYNLIFAFFVGFAAYLHAAWQYNSTDYTATDGTWTLKFVPSSNSDSLILGAKSADNKSWLAGGAVISGSGALDLSSFQSDTGVEISTIGDNAFQNVAITELTAPGVVEIKDYAFKQNTVLTSLNCPNVVKIGQQAFNGATALASVSISTDVYELGNYVFKGTTSLTDFSVKTFNALETIGEGLFNGSAITGKFSFPSVKTIKRSAFSGCTNVTELEFPAVVSIEGSAFSGTTSLQKLVWSENLTSVGSLVFYPNCAVKTLIPTVFPKLGSVSSQTFSGAKNLEGDFEFPLLTSLPQNFFNGCNSINSIKATAVTKINDNQAFRNCTSLTSAIFSPSLEVIGNQAFQGCTSLAHFEPYLPDTLTRLGSSAFEGCTALTTPPRIAAPGLTAISGTAFNTTASMWTTAVDIYSPISSIGAQGFWPCVSGQVFNFYADVAPVPLVKNAIICSTRKDKSDGMAVLRVKSSKALPVWLNDCAGNADVFATLSASRDDVPEGRVVGVVMVLNGSNQKKYHWVVDDTPPDGSVICIM